MIKLKPIYQLICPECGKNSPVFFADYELRAWPLSDTIVKNTKYYDLDLENDFGYMASTMDEAILDGKARCECSECGTTIPYYEEVSENET